MKTLNIIYISLSGNTRNFLNKLADYAKTQHEQDSANPVIQLKEVKPNDRPTPESQPFFAFIPTYLTGGNGIDNGYTEMGTTSLREYIAGYNNADYCMGIVGSGNKNFNAQYCLTARQYAVEFNVPLVGDYELRGTQEDVERIYASLKKAAIENMLVA